MINIISPINQLGYGIASLNIIKHLPEVSLWPIGQIQVTNESDANIIRSCLIKAQMPDFNASCIRIWHQNDMSQFVGRGQKIGFPFFELDKFSDIEKYHLNSLDKLFVSSQWAKEVAKSELRISENNINVVPLGVDVCIFKPNLRTNEGPTVFFNCGKWEIRKGHDVIVDAFNKAFDENDNVELWMMCDNPFLQKDQQDSWLKLYLNSKMGNKIKIINRKQSQEEVYNIMAQTDCGIFPARAEGWNLELLEMLACGKHVITTKYSAHTEFCNEKNASLIDIDELEPAYDGVWFNGKIGHWAKIGNAQLDQTVEHMRNVHNLKESRNLSINSHGIETANKFSWNNTSNTVLKYV
jgi:glycosyltransferase involved in cell wall biosynthesis